MWERFAIVHYYLQYSPEVFKLTTGFLKSDTIDILGQVIIL
jgi:hypothetical protein